MKRWDEKKGRFYDIPGVGGLPSVTTVLGVISKPALYAWYQKKGTAKAFDVLRMVQNVAPAVYQSVVQKLPDDFLLEGHDHLEAAAKKGTEAHDWFERFLKGERWGIDDVPPHLKSSCQAFLDSLGKEDFKTLYTERTVFSKKHGFAGTADLFIERPDGIWLLDHKTSSGIYPEMHLQVVAYKYAAEEMTGEKLAGVEIIRFDKTGKAFDPQKDRYTVPHEQHEYLFKKFLAALDLWYWWSGEDKKNGHR